MTTVRDIRILSKYLPTRYGNALGLYTAANYNKHKALNLMAYDLPGLVVGITILSVEVVIGPEATT